MKVCEKQVQGFIDMFILFVWVKGGKLGFEDWLLGLSFCSGIKFEQ